MNDAQMMQHIHPDLGIKNKPRDIKILFLNSRSEFNMKLIRFFKQNMYNLNKQGMTFKWIVVFEDEMELYEQQGIDKFPVMIFNGKNVVGTNNIIDTLKGRPLPEFTTSDTRDTRDILYDMIQSKDGELDDDDNYSKTITQRMAYMNKMRQQHGQHTTGGDATHASPQETTTHRPDNMDTMMLARTEETKMTRESSDNIRASLGKDDDLLKMMMDKIQQDVSFY